MTPVTIRAKNNKTDTIREEKRLAATALMAGALLASTPPVSTRAFAQISADVVKHGVTNDQAEYAALALSRSECKRVKKGN
jgi:hypothetical protein